MGRERERLELRQHLEAQRPVVVYGEAGVGKTTLVREVASDLGQELLEAGALATLSWLPYLPFRRVLGGEPVGDSAYVAARVEEVVAGRVLLLDDVQWADRETRATIPFLVGRLPFVAAVRRGDPAAGDALTELAAAGFDRFDLEPLDAATSAVLAARLHPDLGAAAVARLVERAGGNPLLIEELAAGDPSESLQLALAARLRQLSGEGRRAMGLLALVGRPLDAEALGPGSAEIEEAGLAVREGRTLAARHALLAEAAADGLEDDERSELHLALVERLDDVGERARHLASAGRRPDAFVEALQAVERAATPGERASHLELAAQCADGPDADRLRIEAADALAEARLDEQALALLGELAEPDAEALARRHLLQSRVWAVHEDFERAREECETGLALVSGSGAEIEARLAFADASMAQGRALLFDIEPAIAREKAERALALAQGTPEREALARSLLASFGLQDQTPGWEGEYDAALRIARASQSRDVEFRVAAAYAFALKLSGRLDEALALYTKAAARAAAQRLTVWERSLRSGVMDVHWHAGRLRESLAAGEELAAEIGSTNELDWYLCEVTADLGRHGDSLEYARRMVERALPTWQSRGEALWALSDAELAAGNLRAALEAADELLERFGEHGPTAFVQVTRAWARYELGLPQDRATLEPGQPMVEGAPHELRGIALLDAGDTREAADAFAEAAARWERRHFRGFLRSAWAEGEALVRAGERDSAVVALERVEAIAVGCGEVPILRRVHRSLRQAGVHRSAPRGASGELTMREREVLGLVAEGMSNAEIARVLGVGRPTVERIIQSSLRKLGARTRAQAAALAERE